MQIGYLKEGGKTVPLWWDGTDPVLIVGKEARSTLIRLFLDDVHEGNPCTFVGDSSEVLPHIPLKRVKQTILYEMDYQFPRSANPFKGVSDEEKSDVAEYVLDSFHAAWPSEYETPQFDMYLRAASLAMMELKDGTLFSLPYLFISKEYRERVIGHLKDGTSLKKVWEHFHGLTSKEQNDRSLSVLNRLFPLITDSRYANVIGQTKPLKVKDTDILIVNVPKGNKGQLIAGLILSRLKGRVYIDRPHLFVGGAQPIVACRYLDELPKKLLSYLLGTAVLIAFRLGVKDTKTLGSHFDVLNQNAHVDQLDPHDALVRLEETYQVWMPEHDYDTYKSPKKIKDRSRSQYGKKREQVEERIARFVENT